MFDLGTGRLIDEQTFKAFGDDLKNPDYHASVYIKDGAFKLYEIDSKGGTKHRKIILKPKEL